MTNDDFDKMSAKRRARYAYRKLVRGCRKAGIQADAEQIALRLGELLYLGVPVLRRSSDHLARRLRGQVRTEDST